jgi:hypothetical protein
MMEENIGQEQSTQLNEPAEIQSQPKKPWLKIGLFASVGLLLAAGLVFAGMQIGKNSKLKTQNSKLPALPAGGQLKSQNLTPTQTPVVTSVPTFQPETTLAPLPSEAPAEEGDETARWKSYKNTKYGYTVEYPSQLTPQEQTSDIFLLQTNFFESHPYDYFTGLIIEVRPLSKIEEEINYRKWRVVGHLTDRIESESKIKKDGYDGVKLEYVILTEKNTAKDFTIIIFNNGKYIYTLESNSELMGQVLPTFKFLD